MQICISRAKQQTKDLKRVLNLLTIKGTSFRSADSLIYRDYKTYHSSEAFMYMVVCQSHLSKMASRVSILILIWLSGLNSLPSYLPFLYSPLPSPVVRFSPIPLSPTNPRPQSTPSSSKLPLQLHSPPHHPHTTILTTRLLLPSAHHAA